MSIDTILNYINVYGYVIIFVILFLGIVGIPAPEESLLFFIGVLVGYKKLAFVPAAVSSFLGVLIGMLVAYELGKRIGTPFFNKFGKYIGISNEMVEKVKKYYMRNAYRTIIIGLFLPGIRQISPYFAGIVRVPFSRYVIFSVLGTALWTIPHIIIGYYAGFVFHINPKYAPYFGLVFFVFFLLYLLFKKIRGNRNKSL